MINSTNGHAALVEELKKPGIARSVLAFAKQRCELLRTLGVGVGIDAMDLAQQAIVDTMEGQITWDPDQCSLKQHLIATIKNRTHKLRTRRRELLNHHDQPDSVQSNDEAILVARDTLAQVRRCLASMTSKANDEHVDYLLMAMDDGLWKTMDVAEETGLTEDQIKNAKRRLGTMMKNLPKDVLGSAKEIGGASDI